MSLRTEFEQSGSWLFRYRSFLPLIALPLFLPRFATFTLLGHSHTMNEIWQGLCLLVSLFGLAIRILTVGYAPARTSGRNTRHQVAETLTTAGMYSLTRNPLYLGNYLIFLGFVLFFHSWELTLIVTCLYALYYERIIFAEEAFLRERFGDTFEHWAATTPSFLPRLSGWAPPHLSFCWRSVLRREHSGLFLLTTVHALLDVSGDAVARKQVQLNWWWVSVFIFGLVTYVTLLTLKKQTRLLHVEGR